MTELQIRSVDEMADELHAMAARYDAAITTKEQESIAKEALDAVSRQIIRNLLAKVLTPENVSAFSIQQFARQFA